MIFIVLSKCRSHKADVQVRRLANNPDIIAKSWLAFAQRLKNLPPNIAQDAKPIGIWIDRTFMRGVKELEKLPPSMIKATCALELALLVPMLTEPRKRRITFYDLFQILLSTPNIGLIREAVLSIRRLEHLTDLRTDACLHLARHIVDTAHNAGSSQIYRAVLKTVSELIGFPEEVVKQW